MHAFFDQVWIQSKRTWLRLRTDIYETNFRIHYEISICHWKCNLTWRKVFEKLGKWANLWRISFCTFQINKFTYLLHFRIAVQRTFDIVSDFKYIFTIYLFNFEKQRVHGRRNFENRTYFIIQDCKHNDLQYCFWRKRERKNEKYMSCRDTFKPSHVLKFWSPDLTSKQRLLWFFQWWSSCQLDWAISTIIPTNRLFWRMGHFWRLCRKWRWATLSQRLKYGERV